MVRGPIDTSLVNICFRKDLQRMDYNFPKLQIFLNLKVGLQFQNLTYPSTIMLAIQR